MLTLFNLDSLMRLGKSILGQLYSIFNLASLLCICIPDSTSEPAHSISPPIACPPWNIFLGQNMPSTIRDLRPKLVNSLVTLPRSFDRAIHSNLRLWLHTARECIPHNNDLNGSSSDLRPATCEQVIGARPLRGRCRCCRCGGRWALQCERDECRGGRRVLIRGRRLRGR